MEKERQTQSLLILDSTPKDQILLLTSSCGDNSWNTASQETPMPSFSSPEEPFASVFHSTYCLMMLLIFIYEAPLAEKKAIENTDEHFQTGKQRASSLPLPFFKRLYISFLACPPQSPFRAFFSSLVLSPFFFSLLQSLTVVDGLGCLIRFEMKGLRKRM